MKQAFQFVKRFLYPGLDITTRQRLKQFSRHFKTGDVYTLEVGCGNGAFTLESYRKGNKVLGIDINPKKLQKCQEFAEYIKVDPSRCKFETVDAFTLLSRQEKFEQILCFEVLEHLENDQQLLDLFYKLLKVNGSLHISTPYLHRQPLYGEHISEYEDGGHLRLGYTHEQLESMLKKSGFQPVCRDEAVGPVSVKVIEATRWVDVHLGRVVGFLAWMLLYPLTILDNLVPNALRLQIYLMGVKIDNATNQ
ncbi:MAG: class I SAM-dependent methyltransferase [Xenococcaceae cyanobacterium]